MSFLDKLKHKADEMGLKEKAGDLAEQAKGKAGDLAAEHKDKVESVLDKAGAKIDEKTDGKYSDKIAKAKEQVSRGVDKIAEGSTQQAPASGAAAGQGLLGDVLADEEEVAEDAMAADDLDPEAPLDSASAVELSPDGPRPQRLYDETGEPIDELSVDPDDPDAPQAAGSSW